MLYKALNVVFEDKRVCTVLVAFWGLFTVLIFWGLGAFHIQFMTFGPSDETKFLGMTIDTWDKWAAVAIFSFVNTTINEFLDSALAPWFTNTIQDHKTVYIPYSKGTCLFIKQAHAVYCHVMGAISLLMFFCQVDFLMVRMIADLIVNHYSTMRFLRHKIVDYDACARDMDTGNTLPVVGVVMEQDAACRSDDESTSATSPVPMLGEGAKRRWPDIGVAEDDAEPACTRTSLSSLNCTVEASQGEICTLGCVSDTSALTVQEWWDEWVWHSDPTEPTTVHAPLNRCQLLGLLICRSLPLLGVSCDTPLDDVLPATAKRLCVVDTPVSSLNIKELKDTVENMRSQWADQKGWEVPNIVHVLSTIMSRFGILASTYIPEDVIDDDGQLEPVHGQRANRVTRAAVRRYLNTFLVLQRSCYVHSRALDPDEESEGCEGVQAIKKHHVFAGLDDFPGLSMHWDVPPAGVLNYVHDFPGMYNNISQVVYYLNPLYKKRNPQSSDIDKVASGELGPLFTVPSLIQMYPEVHVVHLDEHINLLAPSSQGPRWLMLDRRIYLVMSDNTVYRHENIIRLAHQLHFSLYGGAGREGGDSGSEAGSD